MDLTVILLIVVLGHVLTRDVIAARRSGKPWPAIMSRLSFFLLFFLAIPILAVVSSLTAFTIVAGACVIVAAAMYFFEDKRKWIKDAIVICFIVTLGGALTLQRSHLLPREWVDIALSAIFCVMIAAGPVVILRLPTSLRRTWAPILAFCALAIVINLALGIWIGNRIHGWSTNDWWLSVLLILAVLCTGVFLGMALETWLQRKEGPREDLPPIESNGAQV